VRLRCLTTLAALALVAGCGGGGDGEAGGGQTTATAAAQGGWLQQGPPGSLNARLAEKPGENGAFLLGTSDYAVGEVRVAFLVARENAQVVSAPSARLLVARAPDEKPFLTVRAPLEPLGIAGRGVAPGEPRALFVARFRVSTPGRYSLVAEPEGKTIQAFGDIEVAKSSKSLAVGARAFPSDNPTLDDAPARAITTADPPDTELLRSSIRDAMRAHAPFVAVFATPKFCQSRTCGPTVDVVDAARRRLAARRPDIRWIHVEIYEGNNPNARVNEWVNQWRLPSEPWVFLVDRKGVIRAKFEGFVSVGELVAAVRQHLA
jgi:hypothetical protein